MRSILPPDAGPVAVSAGAFNNGKGEWPAELVMIEVTGGPVITIEPYAWNDLVRRIRAARTAAEIGA